jgi:DNA-binding SARP family transcriptional activator
MSHERVRIHLCGRLEVAWDGEQLEAGLPSRQGRLLFAFLVLHRERPVRRDELVDALWSEGPAAGADRSLRPLLSRLRHALGPDRLAGRDELALRLPSDTWVDVEAVRDGLRGARAALAGGDATTSWTAARDAHALAERGLLPGLEAPWLAPFRAELEHQRVDLLEAVALAGARLRDAELPEAERAARRAVDAAPFRESSRAALLEVLRRRGNVAEALLAFEAFRTLLREELGSAPGPALLALHRDLLRAEPAPPRVHGAPRRRAFASSGSRGRRRAGAGGCA